MMRLNHNLIKSATHVMHTFNFLDCEKCNKEFWLDDDDIFYIYVNGNWELATLTCDEVIIKNIIE
jgi:hypothetical protein